MKTEYISIHEKETAAKIRNTQIDAVRNKDIVKKGVRVYQDDYVGISGALGEVPEDELLAQAKQNLKAGIAYPFDLSGGYKDHRISSTASIGAEEVISYAEKILGKLKSEYPDFEFSEVILKRDVLHTMNNSEGLDLLYQDAFIAMALVLKQKKSANLFDGMIKCFTRQLDMEKFFSFNGSLLDAFHHPVALPEGEKLPVFYFEHSELKRFLVRSLNGENYANGSSLFSRKLQEQLFHSKMSISQNRNSSLLAEPFFDTEGVVNSGDTYPFINNGKLINVFTDKRNASRYNLPHTGSASGAYDDIPSLSSAPLVFDADARDIENELQGKPGILVNISAGGDFTADGSFAAPVQVSFLFDGKKILGKLPEFTVRSNIYQMLGSDYIGTFDQHPFYHGDLLDQLQGFYMTIIR